MQFEKEEAEQFNEGITEKEQKNREKYIKSLNKQIRKFCINKLRDEIHEDIEETKENNEY